MTGRVGRAKRNPPALSWIAIQSPSSRSTVKVFRQEVSSGPEEHGLLDHRASGET